MKILALFTIIAVTALGQRVERALPFKQLQTQTEINETATVIRSIGEIRNLAVDHGERKLTVNGDLAQATLAEWLMARLDRTVSTTAPAPADLEYRPVNGAPSIVRVFYFQNAVAPQARNEMATLIRSIIEIPTLFTSMTAGAMVVKGSAAQIEAAQWAFEYLEDKPAGRPAGYRFPGGGDDTIRMFTMTGKSTLEEFNRQAVDVRTSLRAPRLYVFTPRRVIAIRGPEELIGRAAELLTKP